MNRNLLPLLIGGVVVIVVAVVLIFGGFFNNDDPAPVTSSGGTPAVAEAPAPTPIPTAPPNLSAEQTYAYYAGPALEQFNAWRAWSHCRTQARLGDQNSGCRRAE